MRDGMQARNPSELNKRWKINSYFSFNFYFCISLIIFFFIIFSHEWEETNYMSPKHYTSTHTLNQYREFLSNISKKFLIHLFYRIERKKIVNIYFTFNNRIINCIITTEFLKLLISYYLVFSKIYRNIKKIYFKKILKDSEKKVIKKNTEWSLLFKL